MGHIFMANAAALQRIFARVYIYFRWLDPKTMFLEYVL